MYKEILIENLDKIHTTEMSILRIKKNLEIEDDVISYCISKIKKDESCVRKKGKNYYVKSDDCIFTINSSSFTI